MGRNALILGWLGYGNLGDEACFQSIRNMLPSWFELKHIPDIDISTNTFKPDVAIMGGGTVLNIGFDIRMQFLHNMLSMGIPCVVWGSGLVNDPPKGIPEISPHTLHCLKMMKVGVRGPFSKKRLEDGGFGGATVVGNPAFLLTLPVDTLPYNRSSKIIAINVGHTTNSLFGMNERRVDNDITNLIGFLRRDGYEVHLFPMWHGYDEPHFESMGANHVHPWEGDPLKLMKFFRSCYCVIGEKLHACVLAAAAGVPFISISYKEKCQDFAASLDLLDYAINTDEPELDLKLLNKVAYLQHDLDRFDSVYRKFKTLYHDLHEDIAKTVIG